MIKLTRRYRFSASHRLHAPSLAENENQQIYGKCNNPFGHGHDYVVDVVVRGEVDGETGRVVDLQRLDALVRREVVDPFEHKNLNLDIPEFRDMVPTSENVAVAVAQRLRKAWDGEFGPAPSLDLIRIHETRRNIFEISI
jgi:6-pyruvoyltetrahydropterin/6-carboxytetrahydropterin synthase